MNVRHVLLTQLRKAIEEMTPDDEVIIDMGLAMALDQFLVRHEDASRDPKVRSGPMLPRYTDGELLALYQLWSEERYAAGFMQPTPALVRKFREWAWARLAGPEALPNGPGPETESERELVAEIRRQERP